MPKARHKEAKVSRISWQNPPEQRVLYDWETIAALLKAKPMEWALIFKGGRTSVANALRQGGVRCMHPDLGFEFRTANNIREPHRMCDLYIRFNPDRVVPLRATVHDIRAKKEK